MTLKVKYAEDNDFSNNLLVVVFVVWRVHLGERFVFLRKFSFRPSLEVLNRRPSVDIRFRWGNTFELSI